MIGVEPIVSYNLFQCVDRCFPPCARLRVEPIDSYKKLQKIHRFPKQWIRWCEMGLTCPPTPPSGSDPVVPSSAECLLHVQVGGFPFLLHDLIDALF